MVRPKNCRMVQQTPSAVYYKPQGVPLRLLEEVVLTLDEMEALRLADLEGLYHEAAARRMGLSRATFGRIVESARHKVAQALIEGKAIRIEGGTVEMAAQREFKCRDCSHAWSEPFGTGRPEKCPSCGGPNFNRCDDGRGGGSGQAGGCRRMGSKGGRETSAPSKTKAK